MIQVNMKKVVIKILQGSVVTQTVLGGLYPPDANENFLKCIYTVGHKKGATFIFMITLANVDRFQ